MKKKKQTKAAIGAVTATVFAAIAWALANTNTVVDLWGKLHEKKTHIVARIVKGSLQRSDFDEIAVRIGNPTVKTESLSEPAFECEDSNGARRLIYAWNESPMPAASPTFPPGKPFPFDVPPGGTVEATVFIRKMPDFPGVRTCRHLRFSWIDATQTMQFGQGVSVSPDTVMFAITGPSGG